MRHLSVTRSQRKEALLEDRIRVAANALMIRDGKALLVVFSGGTEREHYNFPGGGVELGETLEEAVIREVKEETSLDIFVERLLLVVESLVPATRMKSEDGAFPGMKCASFSSVLPRSMMRSLADQTSMTIRPAYVGFL
jgi:hypothetical protein